MNQVVAGEPRTARLGVRHALWMFTSPSAVFSRIEDTGAYGWALATLLLLVTLLGYVQVQSGLIDRVVDERTDEKLAELESQRLDVVDRTKLREAMEDVRKGGEFIKTMTRLEVIALAPLRLVVSYLLIAAVLYAIVALTGRKPEYHTLMGICVYSGFVDLVAQGVLVLMMLVYRTTSVSTSLGMIPVGDGGSALLAAVDPFLIWYWILVAVGLTVTRQLGRKMAVASCVVLGLCSAALRVGLAFAAA